MKKVIDEIKKHKKIMIGIAIIIVIGAWFMITNDPTPVVEGQQIMEWLKSRSKERTSWDGAVCIALGLMILFMAPLAKIAAGLAIAYGAWTIWKPGN